MQTLLPHSDNELWQQLKDGDIHALGELFSRFHSGLYAYGMKLSSSEVIVLDAIQEVFVQVWNSRSHLADARHIAAYLFRALRNEIFRIETQQKRFSTFKDIGIHLMAGMQFCCEDLVIQREVSREMREFMVQALNKLSPRQKEAIYLKFYFGLSNGEIAEIMSLQDQSVRNTLYEAIKLLRQIITVSAS